MRRLVAALAVSILVLAGACGDDDDDDSATTTTTGSSLTTISVPITTPEEEPVGDPSTEEQTVDFPGRNSVAMLTDVRLAEHDEFMRLVFEFDGDEAPGFKIGYVPPPVTGDPSGEPVEVEGTAFLEIVLSAASGVDLTGESPRTTYTGPDRLESPGPPVEEVVKTGDFEAVMTWVAGVHGKQRFGVTRLSDPTRVVVDVLAS